MKIILLLTTMGLAVWSSPLTPPPPMCQTLLSDSGLDVNGTFAEHVAHRSHSITLEDIRYYFESDATEDNDIATVNFNMSKEADRVLPNAPLYGYDTELTGIGLRHLDEVLSKMDTSDFGVRNYNVLEKIVHVMHMSEMWTDAKKYYGQLKQDPPTDGVCECVTDLEETGVMAALQLLALKIRYPGITSGNYVAAAPAGYYQSGAYSFNPTYDFEPPRYNFRGGYDFDPPRYDFDSGYHFDFDPWWRRATIDKLKQFDFDEEDDELLERVQEELVDGEGVMEKKLDSEEGWDYWKNVAKGDKDMMSYGNFQFAVYMYCMFN